jgi:hypothetical protein
MEPWHWLEPAIYPTCEPTLNAWVSHPAETVSALGYLLGAIYLRNHFGSFDRRLPVRHLPNILFLVGIASILFHVSNAAVFQALDVATVALFTSYILAATFIHQKFAPATQLPYLFLLFAGTAFVFPFIHISLGFGITVLQGCLVCWFWWRGRRNDSPPPYDRLAILLLLTGALFLAVDHAGIACVSGSAAHIVQPHVIWHVLSAISAIYFYRAERLLEQHWDHLN